MRIVRRDVVEQLRRSVEYGHDGVHAAVIVEVGEGDSAVLGGQLERRPRAGGDILEAAPVQVAEDAIGQRGVTPDVVAQFGKVREAEEQVLPSVVVEVVHAEAPTGQLARTHPQSARLPVILKTTLAAAIPEKKKAVVDHPGDDQIRQPVVVEVAEVHAHAGDRLAVVAQGDTGFEADLLKRSVAFIMKQEIAHRIVGDEDIGEAVAIHVREGDAHAFADMAADARTRSTHR